MKYKLFLNGVWEDSESGETYSRLNPASIDQVIGDFQKGNAEDAKRAVDYAEDALSNWSDTPAPVRAKYLLKTGALLRQRKEELAQSITQEMGKTIRDAREEVEQSIKLAYYVAGEGRRLFGHTTTSEKKNKFSFTIRQPIGVVGLITPWNFPAMIPARKIFYSLVCGNTVVFKPSSETPQTACKLIEIIQKTGVPPGVLNLVTGPGDVVGSSFITNKTVRLISFCGHKDTGVKITKDAGVKRVSLELGGKNALIVMDDADLELAINGAVWGGYATTGQRCTATSRVIVHENVKDRFEEMLCNRLKRVKVGDGLDPQTDIGPLVNQKAQKKMTDYCQIGKEEGAELLAGGNIPSGLRGWFFEPTLFSQCTSSMKICCDEIFGPIICLFSAGDLQEAIQIANSSDYGLSSAIYTSSLTNAFEAIKRLQAGLTYVNHPTIGSEVHLPFGGIKYSGNNRESGPEGVNEFSELKTAYINYSAKQKTSSSSNPQQPKCSLYGSP